MSDMSIMKRMNKASKKNKGDGIGVWTMILRVLPQVASVSPLTFIFSTILYILSAASFVVSIIFMQLLFDRITDLAANKASIREAVTALLLIFALKVFQQIITGIANFIGETYDARVTGKLSHNINIKMGRLDPICFENPEILDDINKSYLGIKFARNFINTVMDVMTLYVPYFMFMGIYLFMLKPVLALSILLVFLPVLLAQFIRVKVFSDLEDQSAVFRRKNKYYESCLTAREYLKETRILGASTYFMRLFKDSLKQMNQMKWKAETKVNLIELSTKIISLIGYMGILWMLFDATMKQEITVGAFAAVFTAVSSMFGMMEEVICGRLGYYAENFGKIKNYLRFLDLPERGDIEEPRENTVHGDIILENVSFSYPFAEHKAVDKVSLTIHKGETLAVVGENGSGKSTLMRLITGLYLPQEGVVLHNNKPTHGFNPRVLFKGISGVFQKFQKYQLSLNDNITISQRRAQANLNEGLKNFVEQAGLEVSDDIFPDGYETMLSREFGGIDLSGGQWQRIAIARGFNREHELIILDEPTAAIDPVEETRIYERFGEIARDKTAVIVTHRLGSVKFAHRIVVMKDGKVEGIGSHEYLLKSCPLYREMWESQWQQYV